MKATNSPASRLRPACLLVLVVSLASAAPSQSAWQQVFPPTSPAARSYTTLVEDSGRGRLVLFGGFSSTSTNLQDTWEWTGQSWSSVATSNRPPARRLHASCYDPLRQRVVVFGGYNTMTLADTWEFDGSDWLNVNPGQAAGARYGACMAFDHNLNRTLLFGGCHASGVTFSDTWTWDGVGWVRLQPAQSPPIRTTFAMTWNPGRRRSVLFGGSRVFVSWSELNDTWEFDGVNWQQVAAVNPPAARWAHVMVHDASQGTDVMFGGQPSSNNLLSGTWRLDAAGWAPTGGATQPSGRTYPCMAYDSLRQQVVMFGGSATYWGNPPVTADTWIYRNPNPATVTSFGTACTGSAGQPRLDTAAGTGLWLGEATMVRLASLPAQRLALFALGLSNTQIGALTLPLDLSAQGMPGCRLYTSGEATILAISDLAGVAQTQVAVAANPALVGIRIHLQGIAADPAANPAGLTSSQALTARVGVR